MAVKDKVINIAKKAKHASIVLSTASTKEKDDALRKAATALKKRSGEILRANEKDLKVAEREDIGKALLDRLRLDEKRIEKMASAVTDVIKLDDPVGKFLAKWKRPNGLTISKISVPLGVIAIIYEARPNVTSECASLCIKSGNSVILRGGRAAFNTNRIISEIYRDALTQAGLPADAVSFMNVLEHEAVDILVKLDDYINLVIPRGGEKLIKKVVNLSRIPVIKHYKGVCHVYVDKKAEIKKALKITLNAKCQRPSVCNACETLLVHEDVAEKFLPAVAEELKKLGCRIKGCEKVREFLTDVDLADETDWSEEYLDLVLSVKVVKNLDEAVKHIEKYGSAHTDAIVTGDKKAAQEFIKRVDSSSVMVNASTRFSDGNEYGFGAEIGISTDKIHARGPMGLEGLTSYKYIVEGSGQIRE